MIDRGKKNVLGVGVNVVDYDGAVARIVAAARTQQPLAVTALAVHGVMTGVMDAAHRYRLNRLDLVCPDGQPVRWALNLLHGTGLSDRVYGPNLMLRTCEAAATDGLPIFLLGGNPDLLTTLAARLQERFPKLQIAGVRPSRFRQLQPGEWQEMVEEVNSSGARILLVGLGCPRQEVFVYEARESLRMPALAVGAAFAFHAGTLAQAPPALQARGLEWAYRLVREPRRLWRRYVLLNPAYAALLALQALRLHRIDSDRLEPPSTQLLYG